MKTSTTQDDRPGGGASGPDARRILDSLADIVFVLDRTGAIRDASVAAANLAGEAVSGLLGRRLWELRCVAPVGHADVALRSAIVAAADGAASRFDIELETRAGRAIYDLTVEPAKAGTDAEAWILVHGRNVSSRRHAEESRRASDERFHQIVLIASDAIVSVDEQQRITFFNEGATRIFQYSVEEVMGQPLGMLMPESSAGLHRELVRRFGEMTHEARRMGERGHIFGRRKNGEVFPAEASISKTLIGGKQVYTAILRDISDEWAREQERARLLAVANEARVEAERARERISFYSLASDTLNESLAYDETLRVLARLFVPKVATMCIVDVLDEDDLPHRIEVLHADPGMQPAMDRLRTIPLERDSASWSAIALRTGRTQFVAEVSDGYLRSIARDREHLDLIRSLRPRSCICVPLMAHDRTVGAITLMRDESAPSYSTEDVDLAQGVAWRAAVAIDNARLYKRADDASAQRDHVLGIVSHDLGNALSAMSLNAAALQGAAGERAERRTEVVGTIRDSIAWMRRLIADLLDISSLEAGRLSLELRPVDPVLLVGRAVHFFEASAASKGVRVEVEAPDDLPAIGGDEARVLQVFANLLVNALKFTDAGGRIVVGAQARDGDVMFEVRDTGPGILPEHVPRIFDRFFHAQRPGARSGAGLGLAIAKGIVEAHGGRIWVETAQGKGATFRFTIPRSSGPVRRLSDDDPGPMI